MLEKESPDGQSLSISDEIQRQIGELAISEQEKIFFLEFLIAKLHENHNLRIPERLWAPEYERLPDTTDVIFYYPPLTERPLTRTTKSSLGPANLLLLGGALEQNGFSSIVVEGEYSGIALDQFLDVVRKTHPRHLGLSLTWGSAHTAYATARAVKELDPSIIISAGGPQTRGIAAQILAIEPAIDFVVDGCGEVPLVQIQEAIRYGCEDAETISSQIGDLPGVYSRHHTPSIPESSDPTEIIDTPCMGWEHVYFGLQNDNRYHTLVQVLDSHGCPTNPACTMCGESARRSTVHQGSSPEALQRLRHRLHIQYRQSQLVVQEMRSALDVLPPDSRVLFYGLGQNGFAGMGFRHWITNLLELAHQTANVRERQTNPYEVIVITTPLEIVRINRLRLEDFPVPEHLRPLYESIVARHHCTTPLELFRALGGTMVFEGFENDHSSMTDLLWKPKNTDAWQQLSAEAERICTQADIQTWAGLIALGPFTTHQEYYSTTRFITGCNTDTDMHFSIPLRQSLAELEIFPETALDRSFDPNDDYFVPIPGRNPDTAKQEYLSLLLAHSKQTGSQTFYRHEDPQLAIIAHLIQRPVIEDCMRLAWSMISDACRQKPNEDPELYRKRLSSLGYPSEAPCEPSLTKEFARTLTAELNGNFIEDAIITVTTAFITNPSLSTELQEGIQSIFASTPPGVERLTRYQQLLDSLISAHHIHIHLSRLLPIKIP